MYYDEDAGIYYASPITRIVFDALLHLERANPDHIMKYLITSHDLSNGEIRHALNILKRFELVELDRIDDHWCYRIVDPKPRVEDLTPEIIEKLTVDL